MSSRSLLRVRMILTSDDTSPVTHIGDAPGSQCEMRGGLTAVDADLSVWQLSGDDARRQIPAGD